MSSSCKSSMFLSFVRFLQFSSFALPRLSASVSLHNLDSAGRIELCKIYNVGHVILFRIPKGDHGCYLVEYNHVFCSFRWPACCGINKKNCNDNSVVICDELNYANIKRKGDARDINLFILNLSVGTWIHYPYSLKRRNTSPKIGVIGMTLNCTWWWGLSSGCMGNVEYPRSVEYCYDLD